MYKCTSSHSSLAQAVNAQKTCMIVDSKGKQKAARHCLKLLKAAEEDWAAGSLPKPTFLPALSF